MLCISRVTGKNACSPVAEMTPSQAYESLCSNFLIFLFKHLLLPSSVFLIFSIPSRDLSFRLVVFHVSWKNFPWQFLWGWKWYPFTLIPEGYLYRMQDSGG